MLSGWLCKYAVCSVLYKEDVIQTHYTLTYTGYILSIEQLIFLQEFLNGQTGIYRDRERVKERGQI